MTPYWRASQRSDLKSRLLLGNRLVRELVLIANESCQNLSEPCPLPALPPKYLQYGCELMQSEARHVHDYP
jgi:hypothetical protein